MLLTSLGELQSDFCKNLIEICKTSLKNLPYLTDFSPLLMACMCTLYVKICSDNSVQNILQHLFLKIKGVAN